MTWPFRCRHALRANRSCQDSQASLCAQPRPVSRPSPWCCHSPLELDRVAEGVTRPNSGHTLRFENILRARHGTEMKGKKKSLGIGDAVGAYTQSTSRLLSVVAIYRCPNPSAEGILPVVVEGMDDLVIAKGMNRVIGRKRPKSRRDLQRRLRRHRSSSAGRISRTGGRLGRRALFCRYLGDSGHTTIGETQSPRWYLH